MVEEKVKEYKSPDEIIDILISRNLTISSPIRTKRLLSENNYFFLKGYNDLLYFNCIRKISNNNIYTKIKSAKNTSSYDTYKVVVSILK